MEGCVFIKTFLERDMPQLGISTSAATMRRFWLILAHWHGQTWNASEFGRSFGVADTTVRGYLDKLSGAFVVRQLQPWHENIAKRQVKAPKIYIADTGLLHGLLNLTTLRDLEAHPRLGASWEGFIISKIIRRLGADPRHRCQADHRTARSSVNHPAKWFLTGSGRSLVFMGDCHRFPAKPRTHYSHVRSNP